MTVARRSLYALSVAMMLAVGFVTALRAQTPHPDVFHGKVTTDSGAALVGADVIVTMAPSAETFTTRTAANGEYDLTIPNGTGEYLVYIGTMGRKPLRQRAVRGADGVFTTNAKLAPAVATVAAVKVQAQRARPTRVVGTAASFGTDGSDKTVEGVSAALPPELAGNLDAMAALVPGVALTPNGVSAFGLGADANQKTLNGLAFGGSDLPRDARTTTRFQLSPWDPSVGGFNGALVAVTLAPGDNVSSRKGHVALDHPALQFSDPVASRLGQKSSNALVSVGGAGPLKLDEYFYNYGMQVSRSTSSMSSLLALDTDALARAGVARDTAARIVGILGAQHVPVRAGALDAFTTTSATFIERIDHAPSQAITGKLPTRTWSMTAYGRYAVTDGLSLAPTTTPAFGGSATSGTVALQGIHSLYFGKDNQYLNETTSGISYGDSRGTPNTLLPGGNVSFASELSDGSVNLGSVGFGGSSVLANDMKTWSWEAVNQTTWLPRGLGTLPLNLYVQSRFTGFQQSVAANRLGRFDFASVADLAANRPSGYSRTLNAPDRAGNEWVGAAALGGVYTRGGLMLTGGVRADANVFLTAPSDNADVARTFGVHTNITPNGLGLSPRLGFNWYYDPQQRPGATSMLSNGIIAAHRGGRQIRGGIGEFRNVLPATLLADAIGSTSMDGALQQLRCVGAATPVPDWDAYAADPTSIPQQCTGGAGTASFADSARAVTLFDRAYDAPRTWKANLGWTTWFHQNYLAIDGTYALSLNQPSTVDLNFAGAQRFALDGEGRPVFVAPSNIVSSSGAVTSVASRVSSAFGRVANRVSDLRGDARQVTLYAMPNIPYRLGIYSLTYTYVDARSQARGFDQSAIGDPRAIEWGRAFAPRHQVLIQGMKYHSGPDFGLTGSLRLSSGLPFTPVVLGDVNGDGVSNDRAFIYDPATARDAGLAAGMRDLLANGSGAARTCLSRQLGSFAGRNSCVSPWTATMNAGIFYFGNLPGAGQRARFSLNISNVTAGLDQLIHGSEKLHGWGAAPIPDAVLYRATGFDAATNRFRYETNARFGRSSPGATTLRAPFRVTLDVSLDLGHSPQAQRLAQSLRVRPGLVGTRAPVDSIKTRYLRRFTDIYGRMLQLSDSLVLSREQMQQIQARRPAYLARGDSIYTALATQLASLPSNYDEDATVKRVDATDEAAWQMIYAETPFLKELLTAGQIRRLPMGMRDMVTSAHYHGRFYF